MPVAGRKPKPAGQAINRNPKLEWTEVDNVPFTGGIKLGPKMPNGKPWPETVRSRWNVYSTMPHCKLWTASDWRFAIDTLLIATKFEENHDCRVAAELRNREKVMGTTMDFRREIRVRYIEPKQGDDNAQVANLDDYRSL
jgi:hypothetical protein